MSVEHTLKINPLTDFALETSGVQMDEEYVGVLLRTAIKKPLCVGDDTADSYCWQMQFLVAGFVLPSSRDESELSRARSSPGPHW